jgi:hypothetical protein
MRLATRQATNEHARRSFRYGQVFFDWDPEAPGAGQGLLDLVAAGDLLAREYPGTQTTFSYLGECRLRMVSFNWKIGGRKQLLKNLMLAALDEVGVIL